MKLKVFKHFSYILTTALFLSVGTNLYASEINPTDVRQTHPKFIIGLIPKEHAQAIGLEGWDQPATKTAAVKERVEKISDEIWTEVAASPPPTEEELASARRFLREVFEHNIISVRTGEFIDPSDPTTHNSARDIAEFFGEEYAPFKANSILYTIINKLHNLLINITTPNLYTSAEDTTYVWETHPEFIIGLSPKEHAQTIEFESWDQPVVITDADREYAERISAEIRAEVQQHHQQKKS